VDSDLVGAPGLQSALNETKVTKVFEHPDVGHRGLAGAGLGRAAAAAIASIADQVRCNSHLTRAAAHEGQVSTEDAVGTKLVGQVTSRGGGAGEHHQAAGVTV
jgi:hypothetical protein